MVALQIRSEQKGNTGGGRRMSLAPHRGATLSAVCPTCSLWVSPENILQLFMLVHIKQSRF